MATLELKLALCFALFIVAFGLRLFFRKQALPRRRRRRLGPPHPAGRVVELFPEGESKPRRTDSG
jgi:hypothetical protein